MSLKYLVASGGHKDFLNPTQACEGIAKGLSKNILAENILISPMADGGDGTIDAILASKNGEIINVNTHDSLFRPRIGKMGIFQSKKRTAILEIAESAGAALLQKHERQTMIASSYGVGEMILAAIHNNCTRMIIGLGGSIVSDCGIGMAQALGVVFLNKSGQRMVPVASKGFNALSLNEIHSIKFDELKITPSDIEILVASDVNIPLLGTNGQAATFGPQKGANQSEIEYLEKGFKKLHNIFMSSCKMDIDIALSGAAGGLGAGLYGFIKGKLCLGAELVANETNLYEKINNADIVIVGEGKLDQTTLHNKAPFFTMTLAKKLRKKVIAIVGSYQENTNLTDFFDEIITTTNLENFNKLTPEIVKSNLSRATVHLN
jgi:glycerate 2-kinase